MSEQSINPLGNRGVPESAIDSLKDEFWQLLEEQTQAFHHATYVGLSPDAAEQVEQRTTKIANVCQRIAAIRSKQ